MTHIYLPYCLVVAVGMRRISRVSFKLLVASYHSAPGNTVARRGDGAAAPYLRGRGVSDRCRLPLRW